MYHKNRLRFTVNNLATDLALLDSKIHIVSYNVRGDDP